MRYLPHVLAAALVMAALSTSRLVTATAPAATAITSAVPAALVEPAPPEYFPALFRDVKVWDERPQPATF